MHNQVLAQTSEKHKILKGRHAPGLAWLRGVANFSGVSVLLRLLLLPLLGLLLRQLEVERLRSLLGH